jgi:glycosyltransferase involved in cell wall biosynthesis
MMRALPDLMRARKDLKVVIIGGDGISYGSVPHQGGTWREVMLAEVGKDIDMTRVVFPGRVPYATYLAALRRSDAHVYLTYPFVASWSMREALAIGCPVIGGDSATVREFITHAENGLLTPSLEPRALADAILGLLEDKVLTGNLRENARAYAMKRLAMADYLDSYCKVIARLTGEDPAVAGDSRPSSIIPPPAARRKPSLATNSPRRPVTAAATRAANA